MVRRSLFLGLTGMLVVVLVYLVVQGRKEDRRQQQNPHPTEVIRESRPSLTRVIAPQELQIADSRMELSPAGSASPGASGLIDRHVIVIRNEGQTPFRGFRIRVTYLGRGEKILGTHTQEIREAIQPGETYSGNMVIEDIPAGTAKSEVKILSADMESPAATSK